MTITVEKGIGDDQTEGGAADFVNCQARTPPQSWAVSLERRELPPLQTPALIRIDLVPKLQLGHEEK